MAGDGYDDTQLLRDSQGAPIPQGYDGASAFKPLIVDSTGRIIMVGPAAHGAAAAGSPVQAGGVYRVADPTLDDGDVGSIRVNAKGEPIVQVSGSNVSEGIADMVLNAEGTLLASAARTATTSSANQVNYNAKGIMFFLNITASPGAAQSLTLQLLFIDPVSGSSKVVAVSSAYADATDKKVFLIYPGIAETVAIDDLEIDAIALPRQWLAAVSHSGAGSWTYSLGYSYIL